MTKDEKRFDPTKLKHPPAVGPMPEINGEILEIEVRGPKTTDVFLRVRRWCCGAESVRAYYNVRQWVNKNRTQCSDCARRNRKRIAAAVESRKRNAEARDSLASGFLEGQWWDKPPSIPGGRWVER